MIKNLFIIANTRCNLRCNYCYYNDTERSNNNYLDIDKLGNFIDEKIERVSITGGEPLLNPFIRAYLDVLKDKAKKIILSTNGTLVSDEAIKILKEYNINKVFVSLDSIDNELHDKQRDGTKAQVLSSIRKLLNNNINIQISSVVTAENIENMFKLEQFCIDKKMKFWPQPIFTKDILLDLKSISEKRWGKLLNLNNNTPRMKKFIINYGMHPEIRTQYST